MGKTLYLNINLLLLKGALVKISKKGRSYVRIPVGKNAVFLGERCARIGFTCYELNSVNEHGESHIIKLAKPANMSYKEYCKLPIIGSVKTYDNSQDLSFYEEKKEKEDKSIKTQKKKNKKNSKYSKSKKTTKDINNINDIDDIPF